MPKRIVIDAGIENIHVKIVEDSKIKDLTITNNDRVITLFKRQGIFDVVRDEKYPLYITGKLAETVQGALSRGEIILSPAALWSEAQFLMNRSDNECVDSLGIIDLSASGYMLIGIKKNGNLKDDLLVTNPRCGAGSGINLNRILEKLNIKNENVDQFLEAYLNEGGQEKRDKIKVRADRCGVFSSSATISDKNQGIPLEIALATTMKSEVLKACKKMSSGIRRVYLTGRVFNWQFMRDCAKDYLHSIGTKEIIFDKNQEILLSGVEHLIGNLGEKKFRVQEKEKLNKEKGVIEYPNFKYLKDKYEKLHLFKRLPDPAELTNDIIRDKIIQRSPQKQAPLNMGLDVGSTMAKMIITDARNEEIIYKCSYNNHGDTIETIKYIFKDLKKRGLNGLNVQNIGITGSGRYQVQNVLRKIYPHLNERIFTLVENYAHAHGSIDYAKEYIKNLQKKSPEINQSFYVLVDIGGEDTKISIISLAKEELFDNAMNIKCSAGTGSLMDTLKDLFGIGSIKEAYSRAFNSGKAYEINATCAVFLMENAKKMQALGFGRDEILASCNYAIVENMARTLWNQIEFPKNAVVMMHGQTMLSDPLPLAVTHRLQEYGQMHALVPPLPGHRACVGLIKSIRNKSIISAEINLDDFIDLKFDKKIIQCHGIACGDKNACCSRTLLTSTNEKKIKSLLLGGCTAINELAAGKKIENKTVDAYGIIWQFIDNKLPRSKKDNRLIIPRSFAVSEQSFLLSNIFDNLGIPVFVDNVREQDILDAQPFFDIDVCAPLIGAVGQFMRLAKEKHGIILAPQIDFLPTEKTSIGRTCTTNQGGIAIAERFAKSKHPEGNFHLFDLSIKKLEPGYLATQLKTKLKKVFAFYNLNISKLELEDAIDRGLKSNQMLKNELAEKTADFLNQAIAEKRNITIICGREYILNPEIYDSHAGKLLRDKGVIALPSYAFDVNLDREFNYVYWRNPHDLITKINAIANKKLHKIIKHEGLRNLIKKIETETTSSSISIVQVSTFRCGPDTVIAPTIAKITQKMPSLLIQSDAMIKELAHLENRINTYINQLNKKLHQDFPSDNFEIKIVEEFDAKGLNKETDVIYFPSLNDNRAITSVFRSAGLTTFDNYEDATYDLEKKVRIGRKYAGDTVCAPLAGIFADILLAVEDFNRRKKDNDPLLKGKTRILIFDNKGTGPCRQGQYFEIHKFLLSQKFSCQSCQQKKNKEIEYQIKLLVGHEKERFNVGLEEWALVQSFQGVILQGVLHSILLKFGANCQNISQYQEFYKDYLRIKKECYGALEKNSKPKEKFLKSIRGISKKSNYAGAFLKYFGYGLHNNNGLRLILKKFSSKWATLQTKQKKNKIKIHIEGEAYMRVAQVQDIFNTMLDAIGFQSFEASYSPLWCYLELLLEYNILNLREEITLEKNKSEIRKKKRTIFGLRLAVKFLRNLLAKPLYNAGKVEMPEEMKKVLGCTELILPTIKPRGELPPYLGEAILKIEKGINLFLNVAPEGCMVSSMGQLFSRSILEVNDKKARIKDLFTLNGEVNHEQLQIALLKTMGPEKYYMK
jgi:activator of 2-hydroxyglutaryl-CoA dehydratase/predicted nucleotide-binding protein (sugar kinase/HSP70/actin superfamily)